MAQLDFTTSSLTTKHLNIKQRALIEYLLKTGVSPSKIAATIGVHRSTISREIMRGTVTQLKSGGKSFEIYLADYAQRMADASRARKGRKPKFLQCEKFMEYADDLMKNSHFSPDAVVGQAAELDLFAPDERVCTKTLYTYIDANILKTRNIDLHSKLSRKASKRRERKNKRILGKSISDRPSEVGERESFGHWEIDCVLLRKSREKVLLTLVERVSRQSIIRILTDKTAACVSQAIESLREEYGSAFHQIFRSITSDNGSEFADLSQCLENTATDVYYTHPYSSWERGTNERTNGMIRWFIPKKMAPSRVTPSLVKRVEAWLNCYPRKILGYATPFDVFQYYVQDLLSVC